MDDWTNGGFAVYIHWPFCAAKCPYCDFNSHVARHVDQQRWLRAYLSEIDRHAALVPGRVLTSIFFGGGTPSLMDPDVVASIIARIRHHWPTGNDLEVTLEANPGSVEAGRFRAYAQGGVNRVSMGVQALNDDDLARLGRIHSVAEARAAFDIARNTFDRVSFDLIYARQDQTPAAWQSELTEALTMAVDHLSLYQLTIEDGTAFGDRYKAGKLRGLPAEEVATEMFHVTQSVCDAAGMPAYEVSNHARDGAQSRHNTVYWRYGDYIGIGPGAHGRLTFDHIRYATETARAPGDWLARAESGSGDILRDPLAPAEAASEFVLMGLRLTDGIDPQRFTRINGAPLSPDAVAYLQELDLITATPTRVCTTQKGRLLLNAVIAKLLEG